MSNVKIMVSPEGGSQVTITIVADSAKEVRDAIDRYCQTYHPLGYGTSFSEPSQSGECWIASGWRQTSCD